ncbi:metaxin-1a [Corythoichthys intestinalis]|uniref:metaxin-1a n=1 Tax=Corythoichthys intestinalis TaxID=161448 RepID=UPI0025A640B9|nr:metaxin-1a [Corythoichthys intestinalis]XP_061789056.1 metaxin-1-like [Nerophis lumbriciformis]
MAAPDELFVWEGDWGLPSVNSDCLMLLAYAQFSGAPLKVRKVCNPWRSPGGSLPAMRTADKEALLQPSDIIIHLRKQKYNADYDLSADEAADSLAFVALVQQKLTPAVIYALWVEPKNFVEVTRRWYAERTCFPFSLFLPGRMQRHQLDKLRLLRGDASLEASEELEKELYGEATDCMDLLSQRLGKQKFFFGDSPSSLDAVVFGWLAPILKCKLPGGKLQRHLKSLDNLHAFCSNILLIYFPQNGGTGDVRPAETGELAPERHGKQVLSALVALAAMLSYAALTGLLSVRHGAAPERRRRRDNDDDED